MTKSPTKYQKILINSNHHRDLQVAVVVAVAGAHTREIWSRLPLEIAVAVENRCRGWGPLPINRFKVFSTLSNQLTDMRTLSCVTYLTFGTQSQVKGLAKLRRFTYCGMSLIVIFISPLPPNTLHEEGPRASHSRYDTSKTDGNQTTNLNSKITKKINYQ